MVTGLLSHTKGSKRKPFGSVICRGMYLKGIEESLIPQQPCTKLCA